MRRFLAAIVIVGFFGTGLRASAQMSSTNFEIRWDTIGAGGDDGSSSASYILRDTTGNAAIGDSTSANYSLGAGYRQGVFDRFIEFSFFAQNNAVVQAATASAGNTITCTTAGFSVGDMVGLIQDRGAGQVSAIGQIVSIGAGTITVDDLKDGGVAPAIDGTDDYVYQLEGVSADLGTFTATTIQTSLIGIEVSTDADGGYVVQVAADGALRDGPVNINAVADGAVSVGDEEYGGRSSDTTLAGSTFDSSDTAFTTSFQDVADTPSAVHEDRNFLTLKGSIVGGTDSGTYSQALTLIISGMY